MANLVVSMVDKVDVEVERVERIGGSAGRLSYL